MKVFIFLLMMIIGFYCAEVKVPYVRFCAVRCITKGSNTPKIYHQIVPSYRRSDVDDRCDYLREYDTNFCGYAPYVGNNESIALFTAYDLTYPKDNYPTRYYYFDPNDPPHYSKIAYKSFVGFFIPKSECTYNVTTNGVNITYVKDGYTLFRIATAPTNFSSTSTSSCPQSYIFRRRSNEIMVNTTVNPASSYNRINTTCPPTFNTIRYDLYAVDVCVLNSLPTFGVTMASADPVVSHSSGGTYVFSNSLNPNSIEVDLSKTIIETNSFQVTASYSTSSSSLVSGLLTVSTSRSDTSGSSEYWEASSTTTGSVSIFGFGKFEASLTAGGGGSSETSTTNTAARDVTVQSEKTSTVRKDEQNIKILSITYETTLSASLTLPAGCYMKIEVLRETCTKNSTLTISAGTPYSGTAASLALNEQYDMITGFRIVKASPNCGTKISDDGDYYSVGNETSTSK